MAQHPPYQPVNRLSTSNAPQLFVQLLLQGIRVPAVVLIYLLMHSSLDNVGNAWPMKNPHEKQSNSERRSRWTKAIVFSSQTPVSAPYDPAHMIVNQNDQNRQKRGTRGQGSHDRQKIKLHNHPRESQAEFRN